jgi:hypothetical protein
MLGDLDEKCAERTHGVQNDHVLVLGSLKDSKEEGLRRIGTLPKVFGEGREGKEGLSRGECI